MTNIGEDGAQQMAKRDAVFDVDTIKTGQRDFVCAMPLSVTQWGRVMMKLTQACLESLQSFVVSGQDDCDKKFGDSFLSVIAQSIRNFPNLKILSLTGCNIRVEGVRALSSVLHFFTRLQSIDLSGNPLDDDAGVVLSSGLAKLRVFQDSFKVLKLKGTALGNIGVAAISACVSDKLRNIEQLDFTGATLTPAVEEDLTGTWTALPNLKQMPIKSTAYTQVQP